MAGIPEAVSRFGVVRSGRFGVVWFLGLGVLFLGVDGNAGTGFLLK
jgi:hypothetical protein